MVWVVQDMFQMGVTLFSTKKKADEFIREQMVHIDIVTEKKFVTFYDVKDEKGNVDIDRGYTLTKQKIW